MSKENQNPNKSGISGLMCILLVVTTGITTGLRSKIAEANTTHCSLELNDEKRGLCYQSNPQQQHKQRSPGWPILNFRSYASGNPYASATRSAEEQVMCAGTEGTTSLGIHCVDDGMKVVFSTSCNFGAPNSPTVLELHTDKESSEWTAKVFRNQLGLSIDDSTQASNFVKSMQGHEEVVLVFDPENSPKFVATFKLENFEKAVEQIEKLCPI